jgi:hypothetical protein
MKDGIAEIIEKASKLKTEKEKISFLQNSARQCGPLVTVFRLMFDSGVEFDLPNGDPPYKPQPKESDLQNFLYSEFRRIRYFIKGQSNMKSLKRETMFIEFLESMDPDDAKLIVSLKDKKSPYKGITKNLIKKTFSEAKDW